MPQYDIFISDVCWSFTYNSKVFLCNVLFFFSSFRNYNIASHNTALIQPSDPGLLRIFLYLWIRSALKMPPVQRIL